jgi:hypothetical protein
MTKTDYDPDRSLVLIEGLSHFLTNFLQNLASCQTSFSYQTTKILLWVKYEFIKKEEKKMYMIIRRRRRELQR